MFQAAKIGIYSETAIKNRLFLSEKTQIELFLGK